MKEKMNTEEQKQFIDSFKIYLEYGNDDTKFIIDLDDVWEWVGFTQKGHAKRLLISKFQENIDYKICFPQKESIDINENKLFIPINKETIFLTVNTFKKFCMKASTKRAEDICNYYLKMESIMFQYTNEKIIELQNSNKQLSIIIQNKENNNVSEANCALHLESINELFWNENSISTFNNKNVVYLSFIGYINGIAYYKYGMTKQIYTREFEQHKKTFDTFVMIHIELCDNMIHIENEFKLELKSKNLLRTLEINGKNQTELFITNSQNDIKKLIQNLKDLVIKYPLEIIKETKNEIEKMKIFYETEKQKEELERLKNENEIYKNDIIEYKNEIKENKVDYKELKSEYKELKNKLINYKQNNKSQFIDIDLQNEYIKLKNKYIELKNDIEINFIEKQKYEELQNKYEELENKYNEIENEIINEDIDDEDIDDEDIDDKKDNKTKIKELETKITEQNHIINELKRKGLEIYIQNDSIESIEGNNIKCVTTDFFFDRFISAGKDTLTDPHKIKCTELFEFYKIKCINPLGLQTFNEYVKNKYNISSTNVTWIYENKCTWIGIKLINIKISISPFEKILSKFIDEECNKADKLNIPTKKFHDIFKEYCINNNFVPTKHNGWSEKKCRIYIENNGFKFVKIGTSKTLYTGLMVKGCEKFFSINLL
jgi:hypothetical protein